jgi:hypothetical protein
MLYNILLLIGSSFVVEYRDFSICTRVWFPKVTQVSVTSVLGLPDTNEHATFGRRKSSKSKSKECGYF